MYKISDLLAQISGDAGQPLTANAPLKRKAESELPREDGKLSRTTDALSLSSRPTTQMKKSSSALASQHVSASTAKYSASPNPITSAGNGVNASVNPSFTTAKPPKKGSYAEIMARGKAAQSTLGQIGKIQHKPIEKAPSRRERQEGARSQARGVTNGNGRPTGQTPLRNGHSVAREHSGKSASKVSSDKDLSEKRVKKAAIATTGYTGTARPHSSANRSSSKPPSHSGYGSGADKNRRSPGLPRRYTYASEAEDDEIDEEDYYSEASSDMEAATFEVDEEEERAARIARREDAEALKEENRLKREKEEKRKRLAAMVKSRR